jgi:ribosomal protein S18 acetylase RimI-like enzyme
MNEPVRQPETAGIRKITRADFDVVTDVLTRAFDDDPVMTYLIPQDSRRVERLRTMMGTALDPLTHPYGETWMTEAGDGAALWNPPGQLPHGLKDNLRLLPTMLRVAGLRGFPRVMSALDRMEKKHPKDPHYYLLAIGVDPPKQGTGVGSRLLKPMVARLDAEGAPAYLESSKESNVPLYERFGFKVVEEMPIGKDGPSLWRMWRDPA